MRIGLKTSLISRLRHSKVENDLDKDKWDKEMSVFSADNLEKYYIRWKKSLSAGLTPISEEIPWISFEAADYLDSYLTKKMQVFEFGSGGSTLFFGKRVNRLFSVEHDRNWFDQVREAMNGKGLSNWEGMCIEPDRGSIGLSRPFNPDDFYSSDFEEMNFKAYVSSIDAHADGKFDVVMVDGRARPSCLIHSIPKICSGGLLVLDNSDRSYYTALTIEEINRHCIPVLDRSGPFPFVREFLKTTIWKKI